MSLYYKFAKPPLPYAYNALEPYIDEKTVRIHYDKHLQNYIDKLNAALKDYPEYHNMTLEELILNVCFMPKKIQTAVWNNAGGVYNHLFYFYLMSPESGLEPKGDLAEKIKKTYGSYEAFQKRFTEEAMSIFGSGYVWLVYGMDGQIGIVTTKNQDTPLTAGLCPILNLDMWEHAYYLKHQNKKEAYIKDWFHLVNWKIANENYLKCKFLKI